MRSKSYGHDARQVFGAIPFHGVRFERVRVLVPAARPNEPTVLGVDLSVAAGFTRVLVPIAEYLRSVDCRLDAILDVLSVGVAATATGERYRVDPDVHDDFSFALRVRAPEWRTETACPPPERDLTNIMFHVVVTGDLAPITPPPFDIFSRKEKK